MFEAAELGHVIPSRRYEAALPKLRANLLRAHFELRTRKFPVIVIVSGADGAGKGKLVHRLNEWLDPRGVQTHAFWDPSDEELERPPFFEEAVEDMVAHCSTDVAPWTLVAGNDKRFARIQTLKTVVERLEAGR